MAKVTKVLTHLFDTEDNDVTNADTLITSEIYKYLNQNLDIYTYNNKSTFAKNAVTNITFNVGTNYLTAKRVIGALGVSLGNHGLQLVSFELVQKRGTEDYKHDEFKLQIYNPSSADISADITVQLQTLGFVPQT